MNGNNNMTRKTSMSPGAFLLIACVTCCLVSGVINTMCKDKKEPGEMCNNLGMLNVFIFCTLYILTWMKMFNVF